MRITLKPFLHKRLKCQNLSTMKYKIRIVFTLLIFFSQSDILCSSNIDIGELKKGKIVTEEEILEGRSGGVRTTFWVNARPEVVYRELSNGGKFSEFMPDIDESVLKNSGDGFQDIYYRLHFWFGNVEYVLHRVLNKEKMEITWNLLSGKFKRLDGYWQIKDGGDGSIVTYYTNVEPNVYVPHFVSVYLTKKGLPDLINAVKKRTESDGKWRKEGR